MTVEKYGTPGELPNELQGSFITWPTVPTIDQFLQAQYLASLGVGEYPQSGGVGFSASFGGQPGSPQFSPAPGSPGAGVAPGATPGLSAPGGGVGAGGWGGGGWGAGGVGSSAGGASAGGGGLLSGLNAGNWIDIAGAVLGAYSGYQSARESGRSQTTQTNQTTEQLPYGPTIDHLDRILTEQANLYGQGVPGGVGGGGGGAGLGQYGTSAGDIYGQVAEAGLGAGQTPNMLLAQNALQGMLGGEGATGFEGYNPILADLAGRLGNVGIDMPTNLLLNFLSGQGGGPGGPGGGAGPGGGSYSYGPAGVGGGGRPPDLGAGSGTFQRELDRIFSEEGNEEEIAAVLESMRGDLERSQFGALADLDAQAQGAGRSGGDRALAERQGARARFAEELSQISAQLRYGDLEARRNARLAALNILNSREVAAMQDSTNRAGISAGAGAAAANTALARELGIRGQDLDAIMGIMQGQQYGLSTLAELGERLSSDRLGGLSLIPGLEGISLGGQQTALGAAGGLSGLESVEQQARSRAAAQARERAAGPQNLLTDYLRTVLSISGAGGTSTTQGTNVVPGTQISPLGGAAQGALGGYLGVRGAREGY